MKKNTKARMEATPIAKAKLGGDHRNEINNFVYDVILKTQ